MWYLLPLLSVLLLPGCSKGEESKAEIPKGGTEVVSKAVPVSLREYVYPGAKVQKVFVSKGVSGMTMRTKDDITPVAKFYLDRLGLPDDKVVSGQIVSYLYHVGNRDIMITVEKRQGGSVVSVSVLNRTSR